MSAPRILYVETTTRCNMRCPMCIKQTEGASFGNRDMSLATFERLSGVFPDLAGMVLNGIGEPLLHPELETMVALARSRMPRKSWIGFQSNGLLLGPDLARNLAMAGLDTICLSVDGHDSKPLAGHDEGAAQAFEVCREAGLECGAEFVLMRDNYEQLPRTIEWAARQGAKYAIVSHMLPYAEPFEEESLLEPCTDKGLAAFAELQTLVQDAGLSLDDYFPMLWKFRKNDAQRKLWRIVDAWQKRTLKSGVPVHLARMMEAFGARRVELREELRALFEAARGVAQKYGMRLQLPAIAARHERRCDFLEEGAMCVDVDGRVAPCHFLWHGGTCRMDGADKRVWPSFYGSVAERDPAEIWNDPGYAAFRREALEYEYPYCANCSVTPCSDQTGDSGPFEGDCHGSEVPCGHCHWASGFLHCLLTPYSTSS